MDDFRRQQKIQCLNGSPSGGRAKYGCPCCREISDLNTFKKVSRRLARAKLKNEDRKTNDATDDA